MVQSGGHNQCSPDIRIEGKGGRWGEKERKPFFKYLLRKVTGNCHGTFLILGPNLATGEPGKCSLLPGGHCTAKHRMLLSLQRGRRDAGNYLKPVAVSLPVLWPDVLLCRKFQGELRGAPLQTKPRSLKETSQRSYSLVWHFPNLHQ